MKYLTTPPTPGSLPLDPTTFTPDRRPRDVAPNHVALNKLRRRAVLLTTTRECDPWSHERPVRRSR